MKRNLILSLILLIIIACKPESNPEPTVQFDYWKDYKPFSSQYNTGALPISNEYEPTGEVIDSMRILKEVSGLSESRQNRGYAWAHNDSGNDPYIYLINLQNAEIVLTLGSADFFNRDWEDIECDYNKNGKPIIWLADLGDNKQISKDLRIYRLNDIVYDSSMFHDTIMVSTETIHISYPDTTHDVEAIFTDPMRHDLYLVSKREAKSRLYALPHKESYLADEEVYFCGEFGFNFTTGASTSPDGTKVSIRTYQDLFVWTIQPGSDFRDQLSRPPNKLPYDPQELQGESICLSDKAYYVLGEALFGIPAPLYKYKHF